MIGALPSSEFGVRHALDVAAFQNSNAQINAWLEAKEAREAAERYLSPYLAETGNFLEYQRGMSL